MATAGDLVVNLLGKTSQFESAMNRARGRLVSLHSTAIETAKGIIGAFAGIRAVGLFTDAIRSGGEFNKSMRQSTAVMVGLTDEMKGRMRTAALETAKATEYSASQTAKGFYYLASAGLTAEQQIAALPAVARFAQAGQFDLARATELSMDALKSLGLESKDPQANMAAITRVTDVLARVTTLANASTEQFALGLARAGPSLRIFGKSIEEGTALLAAYADQGIKGEEAGTAITQVLRDLSRAAVEFPGAFQQAGIAIYDAGGNIRNVADIIADFEKRLGSLSDAAKTSALMELGIPFKSVRALLTLLGKSDAIRQFQTQLQQAGGYAKAVAENQLSPAGQAFHRLGVMAAEVGSKLLMEFGPALVRVGESLTSFLGTISGSIPGILKFAITSFAVSTAMWATEKAIRIITTALDVYRKAQGAAAKALAVFHALSGPKGWAILAAGILTAVGATWALNKMLGEVGSTAKTVQTQVSGVAEPFSATNAKKPNVAGLVADLKGAGAGATQITARIASMADSASDIDDLTESIERLGGSMSKAGKAGTQIDDRLAAMAAATKQAMGLRAAEMLEAPKYELTTVPRPPIKQRAPRPLEWWEVSGRQWGRLLTHWEKPVEPAAPIPPSAPPAFALKEISAGFDIEKVRTIRSQFTKLAAEPGLIGETAKATRDELNGIIVAYKDLADAQAQAQRPEALKPENVAGFQKANNDATRAFEAAVQNRLGNITQLQERLQSTIAVFGDLGKATTFASEALSEIKTPQEKLEETKRKIEAISALGLDGGKKTELLAKAMEDYDSALGGPNKHIEDLRQKLEQLTSGLSDAEMELRKFEKTKGVTPEQISQMRALIDQTKAAEKAAELKHEAEQTTEKYATPAEKFAKEKGKLDEMLAAKAISPETYGRAIRELRAGKEEAGRAEYQPVAAMQRGSREAWSNIVAAMGMSRGDRGMTQVAQATRETAIQTKRIADQQEKLFTPQELMDF